MTGKLFHEGGCVNCGDVRFSGAEIRDGISPESRNFYVKRENGSEVILGLCKVCFEEQEEFDYSVLLANIFASEKAAEKKYCGRQGMADAILEWKLKGWRKKSSTDNKKGLKLEGK